MVLSIKANNCQKSPYPLIPMRLQIALFIHHLELFTELAHEIPDNLGGSATSLSRSHLPRVGS